MQYTVLGFSQTKLIEYNLGIIDAHILRWFVDFYSTGKMLKMTDDFDSSRVYCWVRYDAVLQDLPLLGITNVRVIARRFEALCECGLMKKMIKKTGKGTFSCFSLESDAYNALLSNTPAVLKNDQNEEIGEKENATENENTKTNKEQEKSSTVLQSTVDQKKGSIGEASVLKSTVAKPDPRNLAPTVPKSTVATVPKSTVLLNNSSTIPTHLPKEPASASSVLRILESLEPAFIFDREFYQAAADFITSQKLGEDYITWLYRTLKASPDIKNLRGYYFRVFFRDVYVKRFLTDKEAHTQDVFAVQQKRYVCPVCGQEQSLVDGIDVCIHCKTPLNPESEVLSRCKALYEMDDETRELYTTAKSRIFCSGGNVSENLLNLDRQFGIVS